MTTPRFDSNWTPTAAELDANNSLAPCHGCGQWIYHDSDVCNCWQYPDAPRRVVTDDEALLMVRRFVALTAERIAQ